MNPRTFIDMLVADGFAPPVTVERPANGHLEQHTHPFEAKALILEGEIAITTGEGERVYRSGDMFHLRHGEPHSERYGPEGLRYLSGRR